MARTLVASDNFNRADGYGLGANWAGRNAGNSGLLSIAGNKANGSNARTYDNTSADSWAGTGTFTADQYASVVISGLAVQTTSYGVGVIARASGADATRSFYGGYVASDAASGGNQTTYLFKIVAGTATVLHSAAVSWANGDRVEIECEGTTIRLCKNGAPLGGAWTQTDSSISTGAPGISGGGAGVAQGDDWEAGNVTASDTTPPTLTSPTGTATGSTTATGTVSTNEGNGTLYRLASTNATELAATVKAAALTQAVSATGVQNVSFTGLSPSTTYYAHYVHADAAGNDSARVSSASFTTSAPADTTPPVITGPSGGAGAVTSSKSIVENTTAVHTFTANESVTWSISGGADAARFSIGSGTGALVFNTAPNFESPNDADTNNVYVVTVQATDVPGNTSTQTCSVTVTNANEAPTFPGPSIGARTGQVGVALTPLDVTSRFSDVDAGDTANYTAVGSWPPGVVVTSAGVIQGTPTTAGAFSGLSVRRTDSGSLTVDSDAFTFTVSAGATPVQFSGTVPAQSGTTGAAFSLALASYFTGSLTPFSYSVLSGSLPTGLSLNTSSGAISGTPSAVGSFSAVVRATDTGSNTAQTGTISFTIAASPTPVTFSGAVPAQSPAVGAPFSLALAPYFTGSQTPFTYTVASGSLPPGLTLNSSTGAISGTPTTEGAYSAVVRATDASSNSDDTNSIAFNVAPAGSGTLTSSVLKNNSGWVLADLPFEAFVRLADTGVQVLHKTGLTSSGIGVCTFADVAVATGTRYEVRWKCLSVADDSKSSGWELLTAS